MTALFSEKNKIYGALAPIDITTGAAVGKPIYVEYYNRVTFILYLGNWTGTGTITVEKGATSTLGTAIGFNYRKSSTGTTAFTEMDGALTAVANTGVATTASDDNLMYVIEIEVLPDLGAAYPYVGVKMSGSGSNNLLAIVAICSDARYLQALPLAAV